MEFCDNLKELRQENRLTHEQLAKNIGWSKAIIGDWERGRSQPTAGALIALASFFGVSVDFLLGLENEDGTKIALCDGRGNQATDSNGDRRVSYARYKSREDKELFGTIEKLNRISRIKLLGYSKCLLESQSPLNN